MTMMIVKKMMMIMMMVIIKKIAEIIIVGENKKNQIKDGIILSVGCKKKTKIL